MHESALSRELAELQAWYVEGLRPKLVRAAGTGTVTPAAAQALDRRVCDFLGLPEAEADEAAR
jgi:hypothetical protein